MEDLPTIACPDRAAWRAWLQEHHASARVIWLRFNKKHTGEPGVRYEEAVQEALCYGWIDSIVRRLDERAYLQKFTPRTNTAKWSVSNRRRLKALVAEGRMTPAGLAVVGHALDAPVVEPPRPPELLPPELDARLQAAPEAAAAFAALPPSHRRQYVGWITQAKREPTRLRRLDEAIARLSRGERLGWK
ncbi:MAG: YdeI/OmpD-associated family protein [Pseudomonadota bacterium]